MKGGGPILWNAIAFSLSCGRGEGVQGVLILFGRGKAQVCHDLRVVELREQLEVEEEDGRSQIIHSKTGTKRKELRFQ